MEISIKEYLNDFVISHGISDDHIQLPDTIVDTDKIRVIIFPSYIMTGGNIRIEKSKCSMISDDIKRMMKLI